MPWTDAFASAEAEYAAQVEAVTWGHLAPEPGRRYEGRMVFAHGAYGDLVPIAADFDGLDDSPWFFEDMQDFIGEEANEPGTVYEFVGTYRKFKHGGHRFTGLVRVLWPAEPRP